MTATVDNAAPPHGAGARIPRVVQLIVLVVVLIALLAGVDVLVLRANNPAQAFGPHYYMALGDSLSFGFQPNFDFTSGFADDIFNDLHKANVTAIVNYACAGETTTTMIHGGCVGRIAHHGSYSGPQLQAAIDFLKNRDIRGSVSPITLEIGSNDVIPDWNQFTCTPSANVDADLATMDANLTKIILPQLLAALSARTTANNGDLHLLNYYNPFAKLCPNSAPFVHELNDHLQMDAAMFKIPVVDVYAAFGGDMASASHVCAYTWICDSRFQDIHPTTEGYRVIAQAVETALALPGMSPLPGILAPKTNIPIPGAVFRRRAAVRLAS